MRANKKIGQSASRWQFVVGVRLERFILSWCWRFGSQARESVRFWRACGCPAQFRPRRSFRRLALLQFVAFVIRAVRLIIIFALVALFPWLVALLVSWLSR